MPSPRPEIAALSSCYHGGPNYAEFESLGIKPEEVIDFSSNSNPYPFKLEFSLDDVVIDHYPDSDSTELRRLVADQNGIGQDNVIFGSGSMEIIRLLTQAYFSRSDKVLILKPTFGEYEMGCRVAGAEVIELWAEEANGYRFDIEHCLNALTKIQPKAVFICNPNNPTGRYLLRPEVEAVMKAAGDGLVVLDEAYIAFTEGAWKSADLITRGSLVVIRSMTKDFALAGLRLGYALAHRDIIGTLCKVKPPWNVNAVAQRAGVQALEDRTYLKQSDRLIRESRDFLLDEFRALGFKLIPTKTNFFLMKVGSAREFRLKLIQQGIVVRDCASFGLPEYVRIAPRTMAECQKLVASVKALNHGTANSKDKCLAKES